MYFFINCRPPIGKGLTYVSPQLRAIPKISDQKALEKQETSAFFHKFRYWRMENGRPNLLTIQWVQGISTQSDLRTICDDFTKCPILGSLGSEISCGIIFAPQNQRIFAGTLKIFRHLRLDPYGWLIIPSLIKILQQHVWVKIFDKKNFSSMENRNYLARSAHKTRIKKIKSGPFYLARRMCIIQ